MKKAEEIRVREHRLKPSLRLKTQKEIYEFIRDRGLVSALGGNELPSLISAILGRPWKPSAKGFSEWNEWWSVKISGQSVARASSATESSENILAARIFRRTKTFVSKELWPTLDTIVKHNQDPAVKRGTFSDLELNLLEAIKTEDPIRTDRLRKQLNLEGKENNSKFHRALTNLESYALIIGAEDPHPERHLHANIWQTWDTRTSKGMSRAGLSYHEALGRLFEKTIDACVLAREDQVGKWFRWSTDVKAVEEEVLKEGLVIRAGSFLVTPRVISK